MELVIDGLLIIGLSILYVRTYGTLRKVRAFQNQLVTDTISYEETISYDKIIYVYQIALISPLMIVIKYIDEETGEQKKFYTLASWSNQFSTFNFYGTKEDELTKFIRSKIKSVNTNYNEDDEPSRWTPAGYLFLIILLANLIVHAIMAI